MDLPAVVTRYRAQVDAQLRSVLAGGDSSLYDMLRYHMGWLDEEFRPTEAGSGKGVRPALCLFACEAVGGDWNQALPAAAAIELIHNFSLIHDDIQDGDTERHHRPTVWYRWGLSHGINSGAAMNVLANMALFDETEPPTPAATTLKVSRILNCACAEMIEGQTLDLSFEGRASVSTDDYLLMISKKTGALLESSLHMGAAIGTDDEDRIEGMRRFGKRIGRLFQVRDDMLGVWAAAEATGKPAASDLYRRKKSLPVVHALEHVGDSAASRRFPEIYGSKAPLSESDVAELLAIMDELKTHEFCQGLAEQEAGRSMEEIDGLKISGDARRECRDLVTFLAEREY